MEPNISFSDDLIITIVNQEESKIINGGILFNNEYFNITYRSFTIKDVKTKVDYCYKEVCSYGVTKAEEGPRLMMIFFVEEEKLPLRVEINCMKDKEKVKELYKEFTKVMKQCVNDPLPPEIEDDVDINEDEDEDEEEEEEVNENENKNDVNEEEVTN